MSFPLVFSSKMNIYEDSKIFNTIVCYKINFNGIAFYDI